MTNLCAGGGVLEGKEMSEAFIYCDSCGKRITKDNIGALATPFRYCSACWLRYKQLGSMEMEKKEAKDGQK